MIDLNLTFDVSFVAQFFKIQEIKKSLNEIIVFLCADL